MIRVRLECAVFLLNVRLLIIYRKMSGFYAELDLLKYKLDFEAPTKYVNALDFLTKLKFIMAKLMVRTDTCS